MKDEYPTGKADLMTAFMVRAQQMSTRGGTWAMINLPSWMSLKSFESLRHDLLRDQWIVSMVHLGRGVFGSDFGTVAFVVNNVLPGAARGVYRRLFEQHVDVRSVAAIESLFRDGTYNRYEVAQVDFAAIPGSPIVYWLSEKMLAAFGLGSPLGEVAEPRQGLATADNNRFLRQWWEVSSNRTGLSCGSRAQALEAGQRWFPYNKGGDFRRWYGNQEFVVNWENDGVEIRAFGVEEGGRPRSRAQNTGMYFSPSVSWSKISSGAPAFRAYPAGFIFDVAGTSMFAETHHDRDALIAFTNSQVAYEQLVAVAPTMNFEVGQVAGLPVVSGMSDEVTDRVAVLVEQSKTDWDSFESSWNFTINPLIETFRNTSSARPKQADSN